MPARTASSAASARTRAGTRSAAGKLATELGSGRWCNAIARAAARPACTSSGAGRVRAAAMTVPSCRSPTAISSSASPEWPRPPIDSADSTTSPARSVCHVPTSASAGAEAVAGRFGQVQRGLAAGPEFGRGRIHVGGRAGDAGHCPQDPGHADGSIGQQRLHFRGPGHRDARDGSRSCLCRRPRLRAGSARLRAGSASPRAGSARLRAAPLRAAGGRRPRRPRLGQSPKRPASARSSSASSERRQLHLAQGRPDARHAARRPASRSAGAAAPTGRRAPRGCPGRPGSRRRAAPRTARRGTGRPSGGCTPGPSAARASG